MNTPLVSVIMITYGHEKYIKQAIEGVFFTKNKNLYKNLANGLKNHNNVYKHLKNNEHLYIKAYMKTLKITEILNSPYFKRLTWINRLKILIIKLIK